MLELNRIYNMDCLDGMKQIDDNSIDLVLTDPPYGINKKGIINDESLEMCYKTLPEINRVLKDNRFFITYASIGRLPEFFKNNPFNYRWQYIVYTNNGMRRGALGFNKYQILLVFQKGNAKLSKQIVDVKEVFTTSKQCSKRVHPTEKRIDVCLNLIDAFSKDNDIVLDLFSGSGTILLSCKQLQRHFIGFEIDIGYYNTSLKRIFNFPKRLESWIESKENKQVK